MKTKKGLILQILVAVSFLAGGCGDEGYDYWNNPNFLLAQGFQVAFADPRFNEEFVPLNKEIRVTFNEQIDSASVMGSLRVNEIIGASSTDITSQGTTSFTNGNTTLVWSLARAYSIDAKYEMSISTGLRSISGRNLIGQAIVPFFTGAATGGNMGTITVPGPPTPVSMIVDMYLGAAVVQYNEDLAYNSVPTAQVKVRDEFLKGIGGDYTIPGCDWTFSFNVQAMYNPGNRLFLVPITCPLDTYYRVYVKLNDAIDIQGERQTTPITLNDSVR